MLRIISKLLGILAQKYLLPNAGKKSFYPVFRNLYEISLMGMNYGLGGNVEVSGEKEAVLTALSGLKEGGFTIFDVGANEGKFSELILKNFSTDKEIVIHAFEPSQNSFQLLTENLSHDKKVQCHKIALGNTIGTSQLYSNQAGSSHSSLVQRNIEGFNVTENVVSTTLASFCEEHGIDRIHYLKMDVEGGEMDILKGAHDLLHRRQITNIQFEFGGCNIDSRTYFKDFFQFLSPNYDLFLILKDGMVEVNYNSWRNEIFGTCNYLAVLR